MGHPSLWVGNIKKAVIMFKNSLGSCGTDAVTDEQPQSRGLVIFVVVPTILSRVNMWDKYIFHLRSGICKTFEKVGIAV